MIITIIEMDHTVTVVKEKGDPVFKSTDWALAESTFLYHVKKKLQGAGYDCIKKRMWKDGHMVDDTQQYIRDRKGEWCIYNPAYAVYDAGEVFNEDGAVILRWEDWK
jgi:hypothetical protein